MRISEYIVIDQQTAGLISLMTSLFVSKWVLVTNNVKSRSVVELEAPVVSYVHHNTIIAMKLFKEHN